MTNTLEQLKAMTTVVADTGDISSIETFQPVDATTNPSLLLKAATLSQYSSLINDSLAWAKSQSDELSEQVSLAVDALAVNIGKEILSIIPGRISTEVDARLSFDTQATIDKAKSLISLYQSHGIDTNRVLIKIASTWEGIQAAKVLEQQGINCNLTLLFNFAQARACAEAGVFLISPFVGRILDWHKTRNPSADFNGANDPGVQSVTSIYQYYKQHQYDTVVMGASFRNVSEVLELAGCDRLTISPALLEELSHMSSDVERKLNDEVEKFPQPQSLTESEFRWQLNQDPMATEKLAEGIRNFAADQEKLEQLLTEQL